jgi:hypothetical protein
LIDPSLIDRGSPPYLMETCSTPPIPLFSDSGGGLAVSLTWKLIFPFEINAPMSHCIYLEDAKAHVASR